jgi:hypothetical protein
VTTTLNSLENRLSYLNWLKSGHIQAVARWAKRAEIIEILPENSDASSQTASSQTVSSQTHQIFQVKSLYLFDSKEAFDRYLKEGAPSLRAEGLKIIESLDAKITRESGVLVEFDANDLEKISKASH